ncbi:MAG: PHP domain-containing protein [Candidatus Verstraetearchaeota archaeon]|jgi:predicted metal-dependent phosphoesterase TrpH|nr:PHP domain-containing protein [Candidatus Verstraetearchaeota archaeon]
MEVAADFHIHVMYSRDALLKPKNLVKIASRKKIKVLAVTDHNTMRGAFETIREAKKNSSEIIIIPGIEISTNKGHIIGIFTQENISTKNYMDVIDQIKRQDGLVIIPHPLRKTQKFRKNEIIKADLLEAVNGRSTYRENELALGLGKQMNKPLVSGSDSHFSFELGRILTLLPWKPDDLDDLRKMLLNNYIIGIKGKACFLTPRFAHALSFSVETCRRIAGL